MIKSLNGWSISKVSSLAADAVRQGDAIRSHWAVESHLG